MPDIVDRPSIVRDNPDVSHAHSSFNLRERRLTTELFGLCKPHFVIDDVSSDDFDYRPEYKTRSYTLKAPLMQDVHRILTYVKVDLSAILPFNFEKFYSNPVVGDDVPNQTGCVISSGYKTINDFVKTIIISSLNSLNGANNFTAANLTKFIKALILGECFYSRGSLLSSLGSHISKQLSVSLDSGSTLISYDSFFDSVISKIISFVTTGGVTHFHVSDGNKDYFVKVGGNGSIVNEVSFRYFLNQIRCSGDWYISSFDVYNDDDPVVIATNFNLGVNFYSSVSSTLPFNFTRVAAYQLAIAEYMTNDKVDHIYSAELYRQYIGALIGAWRTGLGASPILRFTVNGVYYEHDYLSGAYLGDILANIASDYSLLDANAYEYVLNLFSFKRSLRYKDYFVSSRVRPLAVGDVSVSVDNNAVSVIDVSRKIQVQRFLNAINHSGRRLSNYIKTLFGVDIAPDRHVPKFLAQLDEMVYTSEVENTGDVQFSESNSVTAVFTGNSSNKQLHFYADLPGVIIGITTYDIERAYCDTIDRSFFIKDRFDMFVPELQFVGDQPVYAQELNAADQRSFGSAFGYQYRDMQYKLLYSVADGGFVDNLPGYAFMYNPKMWDLSNISPDFIRSHVSELDDFYLSLTGFSLGSYFHFISIITNNVSAKRPMIANPKILE